MNEKDKNFPIERRAKDRSTQVTNTELMDSFFMQLMESLSHEQKQKLTEIGSEELMRLKIKDMEQNLDFEKARKLIDEHINTFNDLDKRGKTTRQHVESEINTGAGRMRIESKTGATCFVATTAYGDPNHPDVVFLRSFRDETLRKLYIGIVLIALYERIGPYISRFVNRSQYLKISSRRLIQCCIVSLRRFM